MRKLILLIPLLILIFVIIFIGSYIQQSCSDGTYIGDCSTSKTSYYCDASKNLIFNCEYCGCQIGQVCVNNACLNEAATEELPNESETVPNVTEKLDLSSDIEIGQEDVSGYQQSFIQNNEQYSKPVSEDEIYRQINQSREYLKNYPEGKFAENLREKIIEELNIGFLLDGINERELIVTTTAVNEYENYTEKELLFKDPEVGIFSVLLLIPKQEKNSYPAIVGLHGHGDSKEIFKQKYFGEDLVDEGFIVIMPSFRAMDCNEIERDISKELLLKGFTLMGLRVYETHLLIKYLKSKDFVDKNKIGIIGHSGGSHTANVVSRVSQDLKAGVYDYDSFMLDLCIENNPDIHCQTVPSLAYYDPQINDHSTLKFPSRKFEYGYKGLNDKKEVIDFFNENLK